MSLFKDRPTAAPALKDLIYDFIAQNGDDGDNEQYAHFLKLVEAYRPDFFKGYSTVDDFMKWAGKGMGPLMSELEIERAKNSGAMSIAASQGIPSESDLEDALSWAECVPMQGSKKQIEWARNIASNHCNAIAIAQKKGIKIPTSAKWWIDHRNNIVVNLPI